MDSFLGSVLLVIATGLVSLGVAWQQNRFAQLRAQKERAEMLEDRRREASREQGLALMAALQEIVQVGLDAKLEGQELPARLHYRAPLGVVREKYVLLADAPLRTVLADGLTVVAGGAARGVSAADWHEAASTMCFVLAAYLRGDDLPERYVRRLAELRAQYPFGG